MILPTSERLDLQPSKDEEHEIVVKETSGGHLSDTQLFANKIPIIRNTVGFLLKGKKRKNQPIELLALFLKMRITSKGLFHRDLLLAKAEFMEKFYL